MAYKTNKLSMFCNPKDSISVEQKSNVIYRITCPGCFRKCVGKTDRNPITKLEEHGTEIDQPIYQHLSNCSAFNDHNMLFTLSYASTNTTIVSKELHLHNVEITVKILDCFFVLIYCFYHVFICYSDCFY